MPFSIRGILSETVLKPVLRPVVRLVGGLLAIPVFRFLLHRVLRMRPGDAELERDLEMWFRGAVLLLGATANLEEILFGWTKWYQHGEPWMTLLPRLLLAMGVVENMPDQELFTLIHRGPPPIRLTPAGLRKAWRDRMEILRGLGVVHLKRSSPVLVIMTVIFGGDPGSPEWTIGWWCYGLAVTQYLIIALVTDRDRASDLLAAFDRRAAELRESVVLAAAGGGGACYAEAEEAGSRPSPRPAPEGGKAESTPGGGRSGRGIRLRFFLLRRAGFRRRRRR